MVIFGSLSLRIHEINIAEGGRRWLNPVVLLKMTVQSTRQVTYMPLRGPGAQLLADQWLLPSVTSSPHFDLSRTSLGLYGPRSFTHSPVHSYFHSTTTN